MKTKSKILTLISVVLVVLMMFTMSACKPKQPSTPSTSKKPTGGIEVKMSVLYNDKATRMKYGNQYVPYQSLANGKKYVANGWKPTYETLQERLNFTIRDATEPNAQSVAQAFQLKQANNFQNVNIITGPVSAIVEEGTNGTFVNLAEHMDKLPNFSEYINKHEIVKKSITAADGGIYYTPYFDGFDDVETMFICRVDWVQKLLDDEIYELDKDGNVVKTIPNNPEYDTVKTLSNGANTSYYNGFYDSMDTTFKALNKDGSQVVDVHVKYASGEGIIAKQNALATKNGVELVKALKEYIKKHYIDTGIIDKPSELYCGQRACYNADELIALWRCVYTNPYLLSGVSKSTAVPDVAPFYPRSSSVERANQVLQLVQLWGVRGYESRNGYFYFDKDGNLQDARVSEDMMEGLVFLNQIYKEGLILHDYMENVRTMEHRDYFNNQNLGFMTYDYNQTTTIYNGTISDTQTPYRNLSPILYPVADWDNNAVASGSGYSVTGANALYQYTESWRSVKSEGWSITASTKGAVLDKCLEIFDYMYSEEGKRLMTYGPDEYIEHDDKGNIVYIDYKDRKVPKIKSEILEKELHNPSIGQGNYTNYYRRYVGSTLPLGFEKEQGMEYQSVDKKGLVGLDCINKAVDMGTLQHASVTSSVANKQNKLVPTTFAIIKETVNTINRDCRNLTINFDNSSTGKNIFHQYVANGFSSNGEVKTLSKEELIAQINDWGLGKYLQYHTAAYQSMYRN